MPEPATPQLPPSAAERLRLFAGGRLQRRLFVWFGMTMVLSAAVAGGAVWLVTRFAHPELGRGPESVRAELLRQLAQNWDDAAGRTQLVQRAHEEFGIGLTLRDIEGRQLVAVGPLCPRPWRDVPVVRGAAVLGRVAMCPPSWPPLRFWLGIGVGLVALWAASRMIARRLARPLTEVARMAEQISNGNFAVQARPAHPWPGHRDEVTAVGEVMAEMAIRIDRQLRDQRELLAAVSHELRTPLGHLRLLVETQREKSGVGELQLAFLGQAEREMADLDGLVGQLLANARLDFRDLTKQPVKLADLCIEALERKGLDPALLDVEGAPLTVAGDPTLLQRAVANLLDNAAKHGDGAVALRVRGLATQATIEVQDAGAGFGPGQADHAFDPFNGSSHRAESLGLGLHLVQKIAVAHGGQVYARNAQDAAPCGAIVGLTIPAA